MKRLLVTSAILFSFPSFSGTLQWDAICPKLDEKAVERVIITKCLDKECKIKVKGTSPHGFSGKYSHYQYAIAVGRKLFRTEFSDKKTLGAWGKVISRFCPDLDTDSFKNLKIEEIPNRYKSSVFHLPKKTYKNHWFYKEYSKNPDPCVKMEKKEGKSSVILYLVAVQKKNKSCFPPAKK
ncbi:MAG: hypothetical protein GY909_00990 [Oligoflexia bacterium]|nr:hypothetical protein [Oligoflexia bacterium]